MNANHTVDVASLIDEVQRYLAAVDSFREERCEPTWLQELAPLPTPHEGLDTRGGRTAKQSH